jgi:hypothetical protein
LFAHNADIDTQKTWLSLFPDNKPAGRSQFPLWKAETALRMFQWFPKDYPHVSAWISAKHYIETGKIYRVPKKRKLDLMMSITSAKVKRHFQQRCSGIRAKTSFA